MSTTEGFDLPNIPSAYLSEHNEGGLWSVICNGIPVAQGSHMDCLAAAKHFKIVLPEYHWSGKYGKWFWNVFNSQIS